MPCSPSRKPRRFIAPHLVCCCSRNKSNPLSSLSLEKKNEKVFHQNKIFIIISCNCLLAQEIQWGLWRCFKSNFEGAGAFKPTSSRPDLFYSGLVLGLEGLRAWALVLQAQFLLLLGLSKAWIGLKGNCDIWENPFDNQDFNHLNTSILGNF